jgi:23S rRNA (guanosine2251-2'-O)-methyltransferase
MKKLFGKKTLLEIIDSNNIINVDISPNNNELIDLLKSKNIKYTIRNKHYFSDHFPNTLNHQGVIINIKDSQHINSIDDLLNENYDKATILIVDSINDPQNFGAIIRTCAAFGIKAIIYKERGQVPITDFVAKSSMGGITKVNMIQVTNLSNAINSLKKIGY